MGELKQMGIKNPDMIAVPSTRNDAAFLFTVVGKSASCVDQPCNCQKPFRDQRDQQLV